MMTFRSLAGALVLAATVSMCAASTTCFAVFGGFGDVAHRPGDFRLDRIKTLYCMGLRL